MSAHVEAPVTPVRVGAVFGALGITFYDRFVIGAIGPAIQALGATLDSAVLRSIDLREHSFAVFGLALYLATLYRARGTPEITRSRGTLSEPARSAATP